eukprot:CAMPEP_0197846072 /NCGR_PEP_ID=MMETSP1438-20131217/2891_1 /TAXON_ID=1461541 /ORGANISM="Pterosperma sp., Strain CCMP1384" /LENGTH=60 /DNA_ID=CAMNT_0043457591 /DNA_START=378 /DNA_END=557 /DNA_ORIENTATION=+
MPRYAVALQLLVATLTFSVLLSGCQAADDFYGFDVVESPPPPPSPPLPSPPPPPPQPPSP